MSYFIASFKTFCMLFKRSCEKRQAYFILDPGRELQLSSPLNVMWVVGSLWMFSISLRNFFTIFTSLRDFTMHKCWLLSDDFSVFIDMILYFASFSCWEKDCTIWFLNVKWALLTLEKCYLATVFNSFYTFLEFIQ